MSEDVPGKSDRSVGSDRSVRSDRSDRTGRGHTLRPSGGYRTLRSFQVTTVIYDATVAFCGRFLDSRSRTVDQMVQAARSGRQNIAEGSRASATSSQTELRLVNVARASLDELLLDYEDFLRQRGLPRWAKDDPRAREVRDVGKKVRNRTDRSDRTDPTDQSDGADYAGWVNHADPAIAANAVICLIHQANYLLDRQIAGLERSFIQEGGYSENLAAARRMERRNQGQPDPGDMVGEPDPPAPACPTCGGPMAPRTAHHGENAGSRFWGCRGYPECRGTRPIKGQRSGRSVGSVRSD
ncbi:MAG TPA: four helix bundle suffix domain-containing protein [Chloroflexota bacterium]|nr:four helix bundle suffix domain-containing protein [Chloroflexota bacterium]